MKGRWKPADCVSRLEAVVTCFRKAEVPINFQIVGSLRRKRPIIGDIDLLVDCIDIPALKSLKRKFDFVVMKQGSKRASFSLDNLQFDLIVSSANAWGAGMLYYTGSWIFIRQLQAEAKKVGLKFRPEGLFNAGSPVAALAESEILWALGFDYIKPTDREVLRRNV